MIDAILRTNISPNIIKEFLARMMEGRPIEQVSVEVDDGHFEYRFWDINSAAVAPHHLMSAGVSDLRRAGVALLTGSAAQVT